MKKSLILIALLSTLGASAPAMATFFIATAVPPSTPAVPSMPSSLPVPPTPGRAPGLYVQVIDGLINVTNPAGTLNVSAGQFGYTPGFTQPPVAVPRNPGMQFTPPPTFNSSTPSGTTNTPTGYSGVDCEVR